jgi:hypothetical protein
MMRVDFHPEATDELESSAEWYLVGRRRLNSQSLPLLRSLSKRYPELFVDQAAWIGPWLATTWSTTPTD